MTENKTILALSAIAIVGYFICKNNKKSFNGKKKNLIDNSCIVYQGSCPDRVGTIYTNWFASPNGKGIVVANNSTRCIVCPYSTSTSTGMPRIVT